jgi:hypothetical protein
MDTTWPSLFTRMGSFLLSKFNCVARGDSASFQRTTMRTFLSNILSSSLAIFHLYLPQDPCASPSNAFGIFRPSISKPSWIRTNSLPVPKQHHCFPPAAMNRFPEEILDMIVGYLVKSCRRRLRNPFKRSCWKYLGPRPVRVAPFATVCKRFQRLVEPHTFSELYMDVDEFEDHNLSRILAPERVACLRVLECLVPLGNRHVIYSYARTIRIRDPIVELFSFLNRHSVGLGPFTA